MKRHLTGEFEKKYERKSDLLPLCFVIIILALSNLLEIVEINKKHGRVFNIKVEEVKIISI